MNAPDESVTGPRAGAALAQLVGEALARAHPDIDSEGAAEVKAITDAMVRLLIGAPLHSDGKLTIVSLAAEAGLRRNKLTHKHTGLKDLFYALAKARNPLGEGHGAVQRSSPWGGQGEVRSCASVYISALTSCAAGC